MLYIPLLSTILSTSSFVVNCGFWYPFRHHESVGEGNSSGAASCAESEGSDALVLYGFFLINGGWLSSMDNVDVFYLSKAEHPA